MDETKVIQHFLHQEGLRGSYWFLIPVEDVLLGEESHTVHQTHLTVALLSTNIDAFTLACSQSTHTTRTQHTHTQSKAQIKTGRKPKGSC